MDPLASDFAAWSTYAYVFGNPNIFVDPTGKAAVYIDGVKSDSHELGSYNKYDIEEGAVITALRGAAGKVTSYLRENGYNEAIVNATETAFNDMIDNLLEGKFEAEISGNATIGARAASFNRISTGIPFLNWAKWSGDLNLGSVELLSIRYNVQGTLSTDDMSFSEMNHSLIGNSVFSEDGTDISFGAAASAGGILPVGGDIELSYTYNSNISKSNGTIMIKSGGLEFSIDRNARTVQARSTLGYERRYGLIVVLSGKGEVRISGTSSY